MCIRDRVLDDLNLIIRDIRETHKKDSESAPQTTVANELKENLEPQGTPQGHMRTGVHRHTAEKN